MDKRYYIMEEGETLDECIKAHQFLGVDAGYLDVQSAIENAHLSVQPGLLWYVVDKEGHTYALSGEQGHLSDCGTRCVDRFNLTCICGEFSVKDDPAIREHIDQLENLLKLRARLRKT